LDSWLGRYQVATLDKLFTHKCLCSPGSIIYYRSKGDEALQLGR